MPESGGSSTRPSPPRALAWPLTKVEGPGAVPRSSSEPRFLEAANAAWGSPVPAKQSCPPRGELPVLDVPAGTESRQLAPQAGGRAAACGGARQSAVGGPVGTLPPGTTTQRSGE